MPGMDQNRICFCSKFFAGTRIELAENRNAMQIINFSFQLLENAFFKDKDLKFIDPAFSFFLQHVGKSLCVKAGYHKKSETRNVQIITSWTLSNIKTHTKKEHPKIGATLINLQRVSSSTCKDTELVSPWSILISRQKILSKLEVTPLMHRQISKRPPWISHMTLPLRGFVHDMAVYLGQGCTAAKIQKTSFEGVLPLQVLNSERQGLHGCRLWHTYEGHTPWWIIDRFLFNLQA